MLAKTSNPNTELSQRLGTKFALIQAPLGGGPGTPDLVSATCNAGALGSLAGAYLSPSELEKSISEVRKRTQRPFAVNLFAPTRPPIVTEDAFRRACEATENYRAELGLPPPR